MKTLAIIILFFLFVFCFGMTEVYCQSYDVNPDGSITPAYAIRSSSIASIKLTDKGDTININMTIMYNLSDTLSKLQDSSTGCTIRLSLIKGERNTLVQELNKSTQEWFDKNFNK